jgi:N utilization substance protein B
VPQNVAISEAVILSKKFSFDADVQFVNGVLGAYSRSKEAKE